MEEKHFEYLSNAMFMHHILNCLKEKQNGTTKAIIKDELIEQRRRISMKRCKSDILRTILESMESDKLVKSRDATKEDEKNVKEHNNQLPTSDRRKERESVESTKYSGMLFLTHKINKRQSNLIGHGIKIWEITEKGKKLSEYYERVIGLE